MDIETLFTFEELSGKISALGKKLSALYAGKDLTVIAMMNGGAFFACDLVRAMDIPLWFDSMSASSYIADTQQDKVILRETLKLDVKNREILLADDIFDSGNTIQACKEKLLAQGASSVRSAVLVNKLIPGRKNSPDFAVVDAPDRYLVGYGMDSHEFCRNLPYIGALQ